MNDRIIRCFLLVSAYLLGVCMKIDVVFGAKMIFVCSLLAGICAFATYVEKNTF